MKLRAVLAVAACVGTLAGCASTSGTGVSPSPTAQLNSNPPAMTCPPDATPSSASTSGCGTAPSLASGTPQNSQPRSSAPESGGPSAAGPATEFDGATQADPTNFRGKITQIGFTSPSGNVDCGFADDGAIWCQLQHYDYTPPPHDCGPQGWGFSFEVPATEPATLRCASQPEGGGPILAYGSQLVVKSARCVSRSDGITCMNTVTGNGFRVAQQAYTLFGADGAATTVGQAELPAALIGTWNGHGRQLTIPKNGQAAIVYRTYQYCDSVPTSDCDSVTGNGIVPGGNIDFTLTAAAGSMQATGTVAHSNSAKVPAGTAVTATVQGDELTLSFWPDSPFCRPNAPAGKDDCGA